MWGLTPELSRAAKRRRLGRIVRRNDTAAEHDLEATPLKGAGEGVADWSTREAARPKSGGAREMRPTRPTEERKAGRGKMLRLTPPARLLPKEQGAVIRIRSRQGIGELRAYAGSDASPGEFRRSDLLHVKPRASRAAQRNCTAINTRLMPNT